MINLVEIPVNWAEISNEVAIEGCESSQEKGLQRLVDLFNEGYKIQTQFTATNHAVTWQYFILYKPDVSEKWRRDPMGRKPSLGPTRRNDKGETVFEWQARMKRQNKDNADGT